jgi:hypothetical protein
MQQRHDPSAPSRRTHDREIHKCPSWPAGKQESRTRRSWYDRIRSLPQGLTIEQISSELGVSRPNAQYWAHFFGYRITDTRCRNGGIEKWDGVDWSMRDTDIAHQLGVSKERVRQVRAKKRLPPSRRSWAIIREPQAL